MKKKIYIWCCEKYLDTGEGILANKFINDLKNHNKNLNFIIKFPNKRILLFLRKFLGKITDRIIFPFLGIFYLWFIYLKKNNNKLCYVNYLPLWNFLIFVLLPPKTILGPITGGSLFLNKPFLNFFFRKYFLNFFYMISKFILKLRKKKLLFSTDLLKKKFENNQNYFFNYVLKDLKIHKNKINKEYDLIFYLRNHKNKNTNLQMELAKQLSKKFKIITVGKKIYNRNIKNLGFISRIKLLKFLKKTKFAFLSPENLYSLFAIDCINSKTNIFFKKDRKYKSKNLKGIIYLDYNNSLSLSKNIKKELKKKFSFKIKNFSKEINFENYFKL